jgi:hypothetical protein
MTDELRRRAGPCKGPGCDKVKENRPPRSIRDLWVWEQGNPRVTTGWWCSDCHTALLQSLHLESGMYYLDRLPKIVPDGGWHLPDGRVGKLTHNWVRPSASLVAMVSEHG